MLQTQIIDTKNCNSVSKRPMRNILLNSWMGEVNYSGHWTAGDSVMWENYPLAFQGFSTQLDASLARDLEGKQVNRIVK